MAKRKRISNNKDVDKYVKKLLHAGWRLINGRGKHKHIAPPGDNRNLVPISGTPSDVRTLDNFCRNVRRALRRSEFELSVG